MTTDEGPQDLIEHLCRSAAISPKEAQHLLQEVLRFYMETSVEFMQRRHRELQRQGYSNDRIFEAIRVELSERRFASPPVSKRQIRRVIYG